MSSRDGKWWMDEVDGEEDEEYYDVEKKQWVRKPSLNLENPEIEHYPKHTVQRPEEREGWWTTVDTGGEPYSDLLRGGTPAHRRSVHAPDSIQRGLKTYMVLGLVFAGLLALSGRFLESALALAVTVSVALFGRWRSRWV